MENINQGNSLRERLYKARINLNLYGGITAGAIVPVAAIRYGFLPRFDIGSYTLDALANSAMWASAAITSLPLEIISIPVGTGIGALSCMQLAENRARKESKLKEIVN